MDNEAISRGSAGWSTTWRGLSAPERRSIRRRAFQDQPAGTAETEALALGLLRRRRLPRRALIVAVCIESIVIRATAWSYPLPYAVLAVAPFIILFAVQERRMARRIATFAEQRRVPTSAADHTPGDQDLT